MQYVMAALGALGSISSSRRHNEQIQQAMQAVRDKTVATYNDIEAMRREEAFNMAESLRIVQEQAYQEQQSLAVLSGATGVISNRPEVVTGAEDIGTLAENARRTDVQLRRQEEAAYTQGQAQINKLADQGIGQMDALFGAVSSGFKYYQLGKDFKKQWKDATQSGISTGEGQDG